MFWGERHIQCLKTNDKMWFRNENKRIENEREKKNTQFLWTVNEWINKHLNGARYKRISWSYFYCSSSKNLLYLASKSISFTLVKKIKITKFHLYEEPESMWSYLFVVIWNWIITFNIIYFFSDWNRCQTIVITKRKRQRYNQLKWLRSSGVNA